MAIENRRSARPTPYQLRAIAQSEAWINGESRHNVIDDECCPDFSCCHPELFERDRAKRIADLNAYLRRHGWPVRSDA